MTFDAASTWRHLPLEQGGGLLEARRHMAARMLHGTRRLLYMMLSSLDHTFQLIGWHLPIATCHAHERENMQFISDRVEAAQQRY